MKKRILHIALTCLFLMGSFVSVQASDVKGALAGLGSPAQPAVDIAWDRYYDYEGITEILKRLSNEYSDICTLESIGKSFQGKDIWCVTITNPATGEHTTKPAMYIDANIHANEVQSAEVALYTAWYLLEMYGKNDVITKLVDTRTFYIVPTQSPDSRDSFIHEPNNPHSPRTGQIPRDDDGDGELDEDGPDDLNGDGHISIMRVPAVNGNWYIDPFDSTRMVYAEDGRRGTHNIIWTEGFDNDGDGAINEDGPGYYDPNRNFGWLWRPAYQQYGSDRYPLSIQEQRATADFIAAHPNIIGGQSYHNAGGMILRGPGASIDRVYNRDLAVFDFLGEFGEKVIPGYRYLITHEDLYSVYGGETDWMYATQGIVGFVNELWTPFNMYRVIPDEDDWFGSVEQSQDFDRELLFGEATVAWTEVEHPQLGTVEVGGTVKHYQRASPGFLLMEECHRNMAFTLKQAMIMPELEVASITRESIGDGLYEVTAVIANNQQTPTKLQVDVENNITRADVITLSGPECIVSGIVEMRPLEQFSVQDKTPEQVEVPYIPGNGTVTVRWIVRGRQQCTVTVNSVKGGTATGTYR